MQNRSSAVMQQRVEPPDALDDFPTPPWATRALIEHLNHWGDVSKETVWEPACNRGHMVRPLAEAFARVTASDVHDYGWAGQHAVRDFLIEWDLWPHIDAQGVDWVITDPPFRLAERFARRAFDIARVGVALFVRLAFLEGIERERQLFAPHPPEWILQFTERVVIHKGRLAPEGSSATAYCWIIWLAPYRARVSVPRIRLAEALPRASRAARRLPARRDRKRNGSRPFRDLSRTIQLRIVGQESDSARLSR